MDNLEDSKPKEQLSNCLNEDAKENWTNRLSDTFHHVEEYTDLQESLGGWSKRFK